MKAAAAADYLGLHNLRWMLVAVTLVIAPHIEYQPWWVAVTFGLLLCWRYLLSVRHARLPNSYFLVSLALVGSIGVYITYSSLFGKNPGVALLMMLIALKMMEMRSLRDAIVVIFLAYFLVATNFLFSQSPVMGVYLLGVVVLITGTLIGFSHVGKPFPVKRQLRLAVVLLVQAVPLMIVLFVLFPRMSGPLWRLPKDATSSKSGMAESMSPGNIKDLALSDDTAFRVQFRGTPPPREQMYFRGPVLWRFNGRTWSQGKKTPLKGEPHYSRRENMVDYRITLEPNNQTWLFSMDVPAQTAEQGHLTTDLQLVTAEPVRNRMIYDLSAYVSYQYGRDEDPENLERALRLPDDGNPRARALADRWRSEDSDPISIARKALQMFQKEQFMYTLSPPLLGQDTVDDFLFNTRSGFCEHFASSFAFLMRAAGVPARVVAGYQGGELNALGNYLIVRQADAHAWTEIWTAKDGWLRIDPVGVIAPERVNTGINAAMSAGEPLPFSVRGEWTWLQNARLAFDLAGFAWNQYVLGYNQSKQQRFLADLGFNGDWQKLGIILLIVVGGFILLMWAVLSRRDLESLLRRLLRRERDPVRRIYSRYLRALVRLDIRPNSGETASALAQRAADAIPAESARFAEIARLYNNLRYAMQPPATELAALERCVNTLPRRKPNRT